MESVLSIMNTVEEAVRDIRDGKPVVIFDDEHRENEGDLVCAGESTTPEVVALMAREARGLICLAITPEDADRLMLPPMTQKNTSAHCTNFTVSIDAAAGISTGISAADRARTIQLASSPSSAAGDFARPGHIFPLRAAQGGTCERSGHTEAGVDIARMAGVHPSAAICEIMNDNGSMARLPELHAFASRHGLSLISVSQIRRMRLRTENLVEEVASSRVPTKSGITRVVSFRMRYGGEDAIALVAGKPEKMEAPLVRVHSECLTGESLGSLKCDCGYQLERSLEEMHREGAGVVVYLRQEGRGIGIHNKLRAYALQEQGLDTVEANEALGLPVDSRDYAVAAQVIRALGLSRVRLITNNPLKVLGLQTYGVQVAETISLPAVVTEENSDYLRTKAEKLGHALGFCFR